MGYYIHFKMAAGNSLNCEVFTAAVTLYSKFCATCGAKLDEETQALKYYFNEGYEYEVILCFLLKYHNIEMSLQTLKERFIMPTIRAKPASVFTFMSTI